MAGQVEYDTLVVKVVAETSALENLNASLAQLNKVAKDLDFSRIKEVQKLLQGIAKVDFSNVSKGLQSVVNAFKSMTKSAGNTFKGGEALETSYPKGTNANIAPMIDPSKINLDFDKTAIHNFSKELDEIAEKNKELENSFEVVNKALENIISPAQQLSQELEKIGLNGSQMKEVFKALEEETNKFTPEEINKVREALIKSGYSAEEADKYIKKLKVDIDKLDKSVNKGAGSFKKLITQFNRIVRYRIIRKIIQEIYKAISEGITNVIAFDSATKDTIDSLATRFEYLKNSIGAVFAPLIQILAPILETIIDLVGDLANAIAELFAGMNGQTVFSKAKKDLEAYNKEAQKTKSLGIDELNIIGDQKQDLFSQEDVRLGKEFGELAETFREVFGELKKLFGEIVSALTNILGKILPKIAQALKPILEVVGLIVNLVSTLLDSIVENFGDALADLFEVIGNIASLISTILTAIKPILDAIISAVGVFINTISKTLGSWLSVLSVFIGIIEEIVELLQPILTIVGMIADIVVGLIGGVLEIVTSVVQTIVKFFKAITDTIKALFSGNAKDIAKIWENLGAVLKRVWASVINFFIRIINFLIDGFEKFLNFFVNIGATIVSWFGVDTSSWGVHFDRIKEVSYATGGFPEDGVFFANHNELVGSFDNGKTVVANNEQIVEGIKQGVKDAMLETGGREMAVYLDSREIAKAVEKQQNNFGSKVVYGGNTVYGK